MQKNFGFIQLGTDEDLYRDYEERTNDGAERTKIVITGEYKGRHFMIGGGNKGYPVAYIEVLSSDNYIVNERESNRAKLIRCVDGRSNFYGRCYWDSTDDKMYIGWDYGHAGDFMGFYPNTRSPISEHVWSIDEILMEIAEAIMFLEYENYIDRNFRYQ